MGAAALATVAVTAAVNSWSTARHRSEPHPSDHGLDLFFEPDLEFFAPFALSGALFRSRVKTLEDLVKSSDLIVQSRVQDVKLIASSPGEAAGENWHTLAFTLDANILKGSLETDLPDLVVLAGTTPEDPTDLVSRSKAALPRGELIWALSSMDKSARMRNHESEARGDAARSNSAVLDAQFEGMFNASPYAVLIQGSEHVELPYLAADERVGDQFAATILRISKMTSLRKEILAVQ